MRKVKIDMKDITSEICNNLIGRDINSAEDILARYGEVRLCDEKIDEGIDDEDSEDEYLMMQSYELKLADGTDYYIRIYFGNNTREITDISIL